jgi:hypothetical protein
MRVHTRARAHSNSLCVHAVHSSSTNNSANNSIASSPYAQWALSPRCLKPPTNSLSSSLASSARTPKSIHVSAIPESESAQGDSNVSSTATTPDGTPTQTPRGDVTRLAQHILGIRSRYSSLTPPTWRTRDGPISSRGIGSRSNNSSARGSGSAPRSNGSTARDYKLQENGSARDYKLEDQGSDGWHGPLTKILISDQDMLDMVSPPKAGTRFVF